MAGFVSPKSKVLSSHEVESGSDCGQCKTALHKIVTETVSAPICSIRTVRPMSVPDVPQKGE